MSIITIDVNIHQLSIVAQKLEQIASEQSLALRTIDRKTKANSPPSRDPRHDITLSRDRKKRDVSRTKKLY